MGPVD
jgi:hypothetical protein